MKEDRETIADETDAYGAWIGGFPAINLPGDHVVKGCHRAYDADTAKLLIWLFYYAIAQRWTIARFKEESGLEWATILRVLKGAPKDDRETAAVLKVAKQMRESVGSDQPRFAKTSFAREIVGALNNAREASEDGEKGLVFITGESGCGKSVVAEGWCADNNHGVAQFLAWDAGGGKKHLVHELAELNNINGWQNYNITVSRVKNCYRPGRILVVDEVHTMITGRMRNLDCIDYLRRLSDVSGCVIVLIATLDQFQQALSETTYNDVQFWRRCLFKLFLDRHGSDKDIEVLFRYRCPKLAPTQSVMDTLLLINRHEKGGFGMVNTVISNAQRFARKRNEPMSGAHLLTVAEKEIEDLDRLQKIVGVTASRAVSNRRRPR